MTLWLTVLPQGPASFVNPFIGTGGHGHTFPGAVMPFGMVQLSPDTRIDGSWDGCSGYHESDSLIYGFSHTHLSGTGCSDYGDVMLMPATAKTGFDPRSYASRFSHKQEHASAGYYDVTLGNQVNVQLTATSRVGIHQYTFPKNKPAHIIIDLTHRDKLLDGKINILNDSTIEGYRISEAWAKEQAIYFYMVFSRPFEVDEKEERGSNKIKTDLLFRLKEGEVLRVKVGISNVSVDGARKNLQAEAPHWNFGVYRMQAEAAWNKELSKISVSSSDPEKVKVFYTALYHCMTHPSLAMDVDSMYMGRDHKAHKAKGFTYYSVFSLWDTFRAEHPLFTIIDQKRTADFVNTFIAQWQQCGRPPMWELSGYETDCMIGYHSVSVMADAFLKNIHGFEKTQAFGAMLAASNYTGQGIPVFNKNNFLQVDDESESVSKTLEYAYDDWCIAQVALKLNNPSDYAKYIKRAQAYKNVFDSQTGFMRPRKNGNWLSPFDPKEVNNHYTEANSWQYTFFVPQDVQGLVKLMGGDRAFENKLDELFTTSPQTSGREQADITGLIGQYAHGNEPSHHMAYLYNYIGKPYKTQQRVLQIMNEFYKNAPDGLIGNEDCGQMSAWYVMSSMGFYQVCPGSQDYVIGAPLFDSVRIQLENGKYVNLSRKTSGASQGFNYIRSMEINGRQINHSSISHYTLMNGGRVVFYMSATPDSSGVFGKQIPDRPISRITTYPVVVAPIIKAPLSIFTGRADIAFENTDAKATLYYTLDGTEPTKASKQYAGGFTLDTTAVIKVKAYRESDSSIVITSHIYKKPNRWTVRINSTYSKQYAAGGDEGLIDGICGDVNWRKGDWQGYQGQDFECVIDLGKLQPVKEITSDYLQDTRAWILFPSKVEYSVSKDGKTFVPAGEVANTVPAKDYTVKTQNLSAKTNLPKDEMYRYVKVKAYNFGKLPEWHQGAGYDAYIFIDEIGVK
ncbi:MAG: GH92 family glycosyl hydrolase [Bacteroidetes bacterium]|nr:GH92 family glycosyl hydrolase [Bacteroidota bacterium]